ncbi:MAG: glycosyltransferase, partial [Candidatus Parvarchaeota archaeon]|nr:glycosyltransferase [Candidatus Parvarchaeota archaeon]
MAVTLVVETLDPSKGGIPRYNYEISKTKGIKNVIEFSKSISNDGIVNKYLNKLYRRKKALEARINDIEKVVHFAQPEVMFKSKILEGRKTILTVHDLAVFGTMKVKGLYGVVRGAAFRSQFKFDVNRADVIMANSTQTAEELVSLLNVDRSKIVVDDLGIDSKFRKMNVKKINAIGYFGGFNRRKRVEKLILDFLGSEIGNKIPLIIYGDNEDYPRLKAKYGGSPNIIFKGKIPESEIVKT